MCFQFGAGAEPTTSRTRAGSLRQWSMNTAGTPGTPASLMARLAFTAKTSLNRKGFTSAGSAAAAQVEHDPLAGLRPALRGEIVGHERHGEPELDCHSCGKYIS